MWFIGRMGNIILIMHVNVEQVQLLHVFML